MNSYKVIFRGEITQGKDQHKLSQALAKFLKVPEAKAHLLFSGNPICIKKELSEVQAQTLKTKLFSIGIITYVHKSGVKFAASVKEVIPPLASTSKISAATKLNPMIKSYDNLSKRWKKVFAEFDLRQADKLGFFASARSPAHTSRSKKEQIKGQNIVGFNVLAFVFGSLYYMTKGMWKKAIYLFLFLMLVNVTILTISALITDRDLTKLPLIINSIVYALTANYDYYRYYKLGETVWPWMPKWLTGWQSITAFAVVAITIGSIITYIRIAEPLNISLVKENYLAGYKQTTIGKAFGKWAPCATTSWAEQESNNGAFTVIYTCDMELNHFKNVSRKSSEVVTGKVDETFASAVTGASLTIHFTINLDDTFEVSTARWQLSLGKDKKYAPYITADIALSDIYSNKLNLAIGEIYTPKNILLNQVIK
ncbi:DUF2628 domain-containing protein [Shewanella sp. AS16]|uniref:DUF2628 domain-containing protein n=1 Tax=Shewanella sp. AS16 TaxID=2907625 RepID=UPI001F16FF8C|nr:DUF2628 domain-containing protein [Shewanella sp. AS16]MCE9685809.1 DUF2628 domain-containing protein [Shewanella sp. AS16]